MSKDDIEPYYQSGVSGVDHRNIDQAGDGHPFGNDPREFEADLRPLIEEFADDLYESWEETIREYLANAETACLKVRDYIESPQDSPFDDMIVPESYEPKIEVTWDRSEQKVTIKDNGIGMAAVEVDQVFRHIGRSAARDDGTKSGAFGMGALSFVKFIGTNNTMVMMSHSRLNDDNAAYLVSLAGVEPIRGQLASGEYGTKFEMTQKSDDFDVREAVRKYSENQRVTVIYRELDEDGQECFNEDWGGKKLFDPYDPSKYCGDLVVDGAFEAYCSPDANGKTLLLSMEIERGTSKRYGAPYPFDVRILDESGKVVRSTNGNEGLMPCSDAKYDRMLEEARSNAIPEGRLSSNDIIGQRVATGDDEGSIALDDNILDGDNPIPPGNYVRKGEVDESTELGDEFVLIGDNQGKNVVSEEAWNKMDEGRAEMFVRESELEEFDVASDTGDLCLPTPTTNRSSLQSNEAFWEYIGTYFDEHFNEVSEDLREKYRDADDVVEMIKQQNHETARRLQENA